MIDSSKTSDCEWGKKIDLALSIMTSRGVIFDSGLTDNEIEIAEDHFGFHFPADLRRFLQTGLPVSMTTAWGNDAFPNWRKMDDSDITHRLAWPFEGIAFDIEHNDFWWNNWGTKPATLIDAIATAKINVAAAPRLIPICSHRYLPATPNLFGNPVFSTYQTDIIYYGCDLWDYFANEFAPHDQKWQRFQTATPDEYWAGHRHIDFWSDLVRANC